ncbi:MAG: chromate transporter [Oscillospiraceae bacterium]|jgi:chromate transporter|nr:chromate transporter [Oscillospiraceae bacterium]
MTLLLLCYEFFFTGLFAVGGGLATIPFLQNMGKKHSAWFTGAGLADMIAASQCAPGPLGTNMATFVGYTVGGFSGSFLSVLALMTPTVVIDLVIAALLERFRNADWVEKLMRAIRPASAGLIAAAAFSLLRISLFRESAFSFAGLAHLRDLLLWFDWRCVALYAALLPFAFWKRLKKLHPLVFIAAGAAVGVLFQL